MQEGLQKNKHSGLLGPLVSYDSEKQSSLRREIVIYNCKKFYKMAPFCFSRT